MKKFSISNVDFKFNNKKSIKGGFTLIELIVVITILAILGTIAFMALQGYSRDTRDSARISDMSIIKTSLEIFKIEGGKYPVPTNGTGVTYSGGIVWIQGNFGEDIYKNVDKLDKKPIDPLTEKEYTYSLTATKNQYELAGIIEGDMVVMNKQDKLNFPYSRGIEKANAEETEARAIVTGNYNGLMVKSLSGTTCNILSLPTIIANDIETSTDLQYIIENNKLVYTGYKNLPSSFKGSKFKQDGGFGFTPNNLIAYTDTGSCLSLLNSNDHTARVELLKGLQIGYSGTVLQKQGVIKDLVNLDINTNEPSNEVIDYAGAIVNNNLGGKVLVSNNSDILGGNIGGGNSCNSNQPINATLVPGIPTVQDQIWQTDPGLPCYYQCNSGFTGLDCTTEVSLVSITFLEANNTNHTCVACD